MLIVNNIFSLNILLSCVLYRELRFIILKLKIELVGATIKNIVNNILYGVKSGVFNIKYKEPIFKEI